MKNRKIFAVAGDGGGLRAIIPVLDQALAQKYSVSVYLVATSARQYAEGLLTLDDRIRVRTNHGSESLDEFVAQPHDLLILGASQSGEGAGAAADAALATQAPVLVIQDLYGSSLPTLKIIRDRSNGFDGINLTVCVDNEFAQAHLLVNCSDIDGHTVTTGGPQFDTALVEPDVWRSQRQRLRHAIGATDDTVVFLLAGQLNGMAEALVFVAEAVKELGLTHRSLVVCRPHPRSTWLDQRLFGLCRHVMPSSWFKDPGRVLAPTSEDLLPGMDFVLSGYSTTNRYGILHQMPGVVYVGTPSFCYDLWREKGLDRPPEVVTGAAWYVTDPPELIHVMNEVGSGDRSREVRELRDKQRRFALYNDGKATERVWNEAKRLLVR